jgi:hypothetical protein
MNREWHRNHKMQSGASEKERLAWHLEHARQCGCRPVPKGLLPKVSEEQTPKPVRMQARPEKA